ncbi:hypothetical protein BSK59_24875 [Paenibacillus odorifer]|uniref:recombinase family protein n=1 Tax=Paenibacillus odorifer TaxID=189426 RepID=UPI00096FAE2D|nr:recombinase family protein [Paenibacillus odorifer]OME49016.1 hypothetical protein BSK59_24875 [Paenibacillus odorifer]
MKRVWSLYRVSTDRQTDGDDIPVQRSACRDFIDKMSGWQLERELLELGVSGFKKSAKDRDAIETLRKAAVNNEFDVILVFMYDRLGRKHEETPFIVEWLVKQNIEVWSVMEGQRTFNNHVDSLTNYITFWQASGESIKTSQRVTEALNQLKGNGGYGGGTPPYGYELIDLGIKHPKKDKNIKEMRVNKEEAEVVKLMFDLVVTKGFGASRIASWLNEKGYRIRNGSEWRSNYISRILRNTIVIGYRRYGHYDSNHILRWENLKTQDFNEKLVIIEKDDFKKTQTIIDGRDVRKKGEKGNQSIPTKSRLLLSGIATCGYCHTNLSVDHSNKKYTKKTDGTVTNTTLYRYTCKTGKSKGKNSSHETSMFGAKKYESEVEIIVKKFIEKINKDDFIKEIDLFNKENVIQKRELLEKNKKEIQSDYQELSAIKNLLIKVELGQTKLSFETVESMLIEQEKKISDKNKLIVQSEIELEIEENQLSNYKQVLNEFDGGWSKRYDENDLDGKKMMLARVIKNLKFRKDEISVDLILPLANIAPESENLVVYKDPSTDWIWRSRIHNQLRN